MDRRSLRPWPPGFLVALGAHETIEDARDGTASPVTAVAFLVPASAPWSSLAEALSLTDRDEVQCSLTKGRCPMPEDFFSDLKRLWEIRKAHDKEMERIAMEASKTFQEGIRKSILEPVEKVLERLTQAVISLEQRVKALEERQGK